MKIDSHLENLKESVREVERAIREGLLEKQRTLGFHVSAAAIDILEIILHKNNLIDPGFVIKHEWFASKRKVEEKFSFDFPRKKEIIEIIARIEGVRNKLCYGKREKEEVLEGLVQDFNKLKEVFVEATNYEL